MSWKWLSRRLCSPEDWVSECGFAETEGWRGSDSGVASPKKVGGPNHVSLEVSSKSYNIHTWGAPLYVKKTFQRICANPKRGLNRSGGVRTPHSPPWRRHWVVNMAVEGHLDFRCLQETRWRGEGARSLGTYELF